MNDAAFSPCSLYRYWLLRELRHTACAVRMRRIAWLMLNPSTADCTVNDPTIKQVMAFSMIWGFDAAEVVNLFAWRATDPRELRKAADPIGPKNDGWIADTVNGCELLICAWGAHPMARARAAQILPHIQTPMMCLGTTKTGMPWHPLYRPHDLKPKNWSMPN